MKRYLALRLVAAVVAVLSLLLSQLAMAGYVCPLEAQVSGMPMTADASCDQMDEAQPALCHEHCTAPGKTSGSFELPVLSLPAVVLVLALPVLLEGGDERLIAASRHVEGHPPPSPVFLSTLRLRV